MSESSEFWEDVDNDQEAAEDKIEDELDKVKLYVEGDDDIPFWYAIFKKFAPTLKIEFDYVSLSASEKLEESANDCDGTESEEHNPRGKDILLKKVRLNKEFVGSHRLICIDSDYDHLIPNTKNAEIMRSRKRYILQTYTHSIENYKCLAESLECICVDATYNAEQKFDFIQFIKEYSEKVYGLFVYSVYTKRKNLTEPIECGGNVAIGNCLNIEDNAKRTLEQLEEKVEKIVDDFDNENPDIGEEINALKIDLESLGVKRENVYLFIHGKTLLHGVVAPLLKQTIRAPKQERHKEITTKSKESGANKETKSRWHDSYNEMMLHTKALLNVNKAHLYHDCPQLKWIERDINEFLQKHPVSR